jgi:hypothetical protein
VTSSSVTNPHDSTSTSTNGSTTNSCSSAEDPDPTTTPESTPPLSPLPVFDHLEIRDPDHQAKPRVDPRYDPSLTLAQRLEASTDLPLAPFSDYEWKKENEYLGSRLIGGVVIRGLGSIRALEEWEGEIVEEEKGEIGGRK